MSTFNQQHPELQDGEVFLQNSANPEMTSIPFKTKRLGKVAYDIHGKVSQGLFPVFKKKTDVIVPSLLGALQSGARITFDDHSYLQGAPNDDCMLVGTEYEFSDKAPLTEDGLKQAFISLEAMRQDLKSI
jgi:hypothetical protein